VTAQVWEQDVPGDAHRAELQRTVQQVWTDVLLDRAGGADGAPAVQARITAELRSIADWLGDNRGTDPETQAHRTEVRAAIERFLGRSQDEVQPPADLETPPGSPIGSAPPAHVRQEQRKQALEVWAPAGMRCVRAGE
jgi:hypothetical protein